MIYITIYIDVMGKRKCAENLVRFVWKRNPMYDVLLLSQVKSKNPYSFDNQKSVWTDIANVLQKGALKMKVTERSCRERVTHLLETYRQNDGQSDSS